MGFEVPIIPKEWSKKLLVVIEGRRWLDEYKVSLRRVLDKAGYKYNDVAIYFATRSSSHIEANMWQLRACRPFLLAVIEELKPAHILLLGDKALRSALSRGNTSVTKQRGKLLNLPGLPCQNSGSLLGHDVAVFDAQVSCTYDPLVTNEGFIQADLQRNWIKTHWPGDEVPSGKTIGVDTESDSGELLTIGVANATSATAFEGFELAKAGSVIGSAEWLVGHSVFEDIAWLRRSGLPLKRGWIDGTKVLDSLLLARMADENEANYSLETALLKFVFCDPWKDRTTNYLSKMRTCPPELRRERCRLDAWGSYLLALQTFSGKSRSLIEFTHRIAACLHRITLAGAFVDVAKHAAITAELKKKIVSLEDSLREEAFKHGLTEFNPTNDGHLRTLFFEKLGQLPSLLTKKKQLPAVDQLSLKMMNHPVANLLIEFNKVDKLNSIQGEGLLEFINPIDSNLGYLPFRHNPLGARTGRRSSSEPNAQNWPVRMRQIVRSRWEHGLIGDFDYKSLEPVIIAWVAQDEKLMNAFTVGRGYLDVAEEVLGITVKKGTKPYVAVKSIVLGVHYNMKTHKMADDLWRRLDVHFSEDFREHIRETGRIRSKYLAQYPGLCSYMEEQEQRVLRDQFVESITGRIRRLPLPDGRDSKGFGHVVNQAINFPITSPAADITGSAIIDVEAAILDDLGLSLEDFYDLLLDFQKKCLTAASNSVILYPKMTFLINEVHDSLVADIHPDLVKRHTELIIETMRTVPTLRSLWPITKEIPLRIEPTIAAFWGSKT